MTHRSIDSLEALVGSCQPGWSLSGAFYSDEAVYRDPSCVKVIRSRRGRALYFSRSPIPHHRDGPPDFTAETPAALLHLGLYAYRRDFLERTPIESAAGLCPTRKSSRTTIRSAHAPSSAPPPRRVC